MSVGRSSVSRPGGNGGDTARRAACRRETEARATWDGRVPSITGVTPRRTPAPALRSHARGGRSADPQTPQLHRVDRLGVVGVAAEERHDTGDGRLVVRGIRDRGHDLGDRLASGAQCPQHAQAIGGRLPRVGRRGVPGHARAVSVDHLVGEVDAQRFRGEPEGGGERDDVVRAGCQLSPGNRAHTRGDASVLSGVERDGSAIAGPGVGEAGPRAIRGDDGGDRVERVLGRNPARRSLVDDVDEQGVDIR